MTRGKKKDNFLKFHLASHLCGSQKSVKEYIFGGSVSLALGCERVWDGMFYYLPELGAILLVP